MIRLKREERLFEFTDPEYGWNVLTVREALRAYMCPNRDCGIPMLGIMRMNGAREKRSVRAEFRLESTDPAQLHLARFFAGKGNRYIPPSFESQFFRTPSGEAGQVFWCTKHFGAFDNTEYGQCPVTRVIMPLPGKSPLLPLIEQLEISYKDRAQQFVYVKRHVRQHKALHDFALKCWFEKNRLHQVEDSFGVGPTVWAMKRNEWYRYDVQNWITEIQSEQHRLYPSIPWALTGTSLVSEPDYDLEPFAVPKEDEPESESVPEQAAAPELSDPKWSRLLRLLGAPGQN